MTTSMSGTLDRYLSLKELYAQLDELADRHPNRIARRVIGKSREGRDILAFTVGSGSRQAIWYAGPHANEPVGGNTIVTIATQWVTDPASVDQAWTLNLIPCIDPDGYVLNEGWLDGPYTTSHYHRNMYRPAENEWPDWDMPIDHGVVQRASTLPEAIALRAFIDEVQPQFLFALHNGEVGGAFFYLTGEDLSLANQLSALPERHGFPLETAPFEDPGVRALAPGVLELPTMARLCQALVASGHEDPSSLLRRGESAPTYATRYGTTSLVAEVPYWCGRELPRDDPRPTFGELLRGVSTDVGRFAEWLSTAFEQVRRACVTDGALVRSLAGGPPFLARYAAGMAEFAASVPDGDRVATDDEIMGYGVMLGTATLQRYRGALLRVIDECCPPTALDALRREVERDFDAVDAHLATKIGAPNSPALLAALQVEAGLLTQRLLAD